MVTIKTKNKGDNMDKPKLKDVLESLDRIDSRRKDKTESITKVKEFVNSLTKKTQDKNSLIQNTKEKQ